MRLVSHAAFWPNACVCGSVDGPFVDLEIDRPIAGRDSRLYLCQRCGKGAAREFGFAKGKRMDELAEADKKLHVAQQQIDRQDAANAEYEATILARDQRIEALVETNTAQAERIAQLVAALKDEAKALTSVVGE